MIAILLYSLLFIFTLICTFSTTKTKLLSLWSPKPKHIPDPPPNTINTPVPDQSDQSPVEPSELISSKSESLKSVFATFDKNRDGYITHKELKESLRNIGISADENEVADMVSKVDSNGDGLIDFEEFCELFKSVSGDRKVDDEEMREAFEVFDGNRDGLITVEELGLVLSSLGFVEGNKIEDCKEMISKVDIDGDGMVNFDEFKTMMKNGNLLARPIAVSS